MGLSDGANAGVHAVYGLRVIIMRLLSLSRGGSMGIHVGRS